MWRGGTTSQAAALPFSGAVSEGDRQTNGCSLLQQELCQQTIMI